MVDENMGWWGGLEFIIGGRDVKLLRLIISLFKGKVANKRGYFGVKKEYELQ